MTNRHEARVRAPYRDVGAAMRRAVDRAVEAGLPESCWKVLAALFGIVLSYSRLGDEVFAEQIEAQYRVPLSTTRKALRRLHQAGVIEYEGQRGPGRPGLVRFPLSDHPEGQSETPAECPPGRSLNDRVSDQLSDQLSDHLEGHIPRSTEKSEKKSSVPAVASYDDEAIADLPLDFDENGKPRPLDGDTIVPVYCKEHDYRYRARLSDIGAGGGKCPKCEADDLSAGKRLKQLSKGIR